MSNTFNFFFDIDGTLTANGGVPTSEVQNALSYAQSKGCRIFLNTGRTKATLPPSLTTLDCIDGYCCGCGTYIEFKGKPLLEHYIEYSELLKITELFKPYSASTCLVYEGIDTVYRYGNPFYPFADIDFFDLTSEKDIPKRLENAKIHKLTLQSHDCDFPYLLKDDFDIIDCRFYFEIIPKGFDKGKAIEATEKALGLDKNASVAVGDSANDVKMLEYAAISVAMGNAPTAVKALCDKVTDIVQNDGVAKLIYDTVK